MNYYQHHIGDWRTATYNLTRTQRDIYHSLICTYYDKEQPLTSDMEMLAENHGVRGAEELSALSYILKRYFTLEGGFYVHARCAEVIAEFHRVVEVARKAGKASATARSQRKLNARSTEAPTEAQQDGNSTSTERQPPGNPVTQSSSTNVEETLGAASAAPAEKVVRPTRKCPKDFLITPALAEWATGTHPDPEQDAKRPHLSLQIITLETDKFRDHTFSKPISDWAGAWRNWMRNVRSVVPRAIPAVQQRKQETQSFMDRVKGAQHGASGQGTIDVESRVVGRDS